MRTLFNVYSHTHVPLFGKNRIDSVTFFNFSSIWNLIQNSFSLYRLRSGMKRKKKRCETEDWRFNQGVCGRKTDVSNDEKQRKSGIKQKNWRPNGTKSSSSNQKNVNQFSPLSAMTKMRTSRILENWVVVFVAVFFCRIYTSKNCVRWCVTMQLMQSIFFKNNLYNSLNFSRLVICFWLQMPPTFFTHSKKCSRPLVSSKDILFCTAFFFF